MSLVNTLEKTEDLRDKPGELRRNKLVDRCLAALLLSNLENREHLKNFRNVYCVLANHNNVQDKRANLKTTN